LGNRNVEDQDLIGRTGMVSCFGAAGSFFSRFDIWTRFRLNFFGEAATGIEGASHIYRWGILTHWDENVTFALFIESLYLSNDAIKP
jgi:hypothetical protein